MVLQEPVQFEVPKLHIAKFPRHALAEMAEVGSMLLKSAKDILSLFPNAVDFHTMRFDFGLDIAQGHFDVFSVATKALRDCRLIV